MKILIIGGTGTMGRPLVELLSKNRNNNLYVISRSEQKAWGGNNIISVKGDALELEFMNRILEAQYDAIVDFMWYTAQEFEKRYEKLIMSASHYIYFSSAAVYADSDDEIAETDKRFYDEASPEAIAGSREYHMEKAKIENILFNSRYHNWTLIRPHVTFNSNRLPLYTWEKEQWLYRIVQGHTLVLPEDSLDKKTVITYGGDVAKALEALLGKKEAFGEAINICSGKPITRKALVDLYARVLSNLFGLELKMIYEKDTEKIKRAFPEKRDRMEHDRLLNRTFSIEKMRSIIGDIEFSNLEESMTACIEEYVGGLDMESIRYSDPHFCAYMDKMAREKTPLRFFDGKKCKIKYLLARYLPSYQMYIDAFYFLKKRTGYRC